MDELGTDSTQHHLHGHGYRLTQCASLYARSHTTPAPGSKLVEIEGGMVPLPDQMPEVFARTVMEFLGGIEFTHVAAVAKPTSSF